MSDSSGTAKISLKQRKVLEAHQLAIGRLCMGWAILDRELDHLIQAMLGSSYEEAHAIGTALDSVAGRCQLAKTLSYLHSPSDEWRDLFKHMVNHITNELAPRRNRLVHDNWHESGEPNTALKIDRRVRTQDVEEASQRYLYNRAEAISVQEIDDFGLQVLNVNVAIVYAQRDLRRNAKATRPKEPGEVSLQFLTEGPKLLPPTMSQRRNAKRQRPHRS